MFNFLQITADKGIDLIMWGLGLIGAGIIFIIKCLYNNHNRIKDNTSSIEKLEIGRKACFDSIKNIEAKISEIEKDLIQCKFTERDVEALTAIIKEMGENLKGWQAETLQLIKKPKDEK